MLPAVIIERIPDFVNTALVRICNRSSVHGEADDMLQKPRLVHNMVVAVHQKCLQTMWPIECRIILISQHDIENITGTVNFDFLEAHIQP